MPGYYMGTYPSLKAALAATKKQMEAQGFTKVTGKLLPTKHPGIYRTDDKNWEAIKTRQKWSLRRVKSKVVVLQGKTLPEIKRFLKTKAAKTYGQPTNA